MQVESTAETSSVASIQRGGVKKFGPTLAVMNIPANDGIATIRLGTKAYRIVAPSEEVRDVIINTHTVDTQVKVSGRLNTKDARDPYIIVDRLEKGVPMRTGVGFISKRDNGDLFTEIRVGSSYIPVVLKPKKGTRAMIERAAQGANHGWLNLTGKIDKQAGTMEVWFTSLLRRYDF